MDDTVRTVKGDPGLILEAVNNLHRNLQFTMEELDSNGNLAFLDLNVNVDSGKKVFRSTSTWETFDQALEKNQKQWIKNQYPKNWSDRVVFETLNKIIEGRFNLDTCAKGGYTHIRHNEIRDTFANLMNEVCHNVEIEPKLQPLQGESFVNNSTTTKDEARLDIKANGLWGSRFSRAFFDVKIFNPHA